jgi:serine/threonine-protein kinase
MSQPLVAGAIVDRYRVEAVIGAGSMGDVFRGEDVDLGRRVAIKILSDRHRDNKELRARFVREARAVAAISHPNVVQVFTTGTYDDRPYIAMEFLDGTDLGSFIDEQGIMTSSQAARAVADAARGLDAAAKAGLIHRDVKPSNLVLINDGTVKVTDFGLAKPVDPGNEPALTALGVVVGTPDYIAPEQARGDPIDERVDIYALGGSLFYLVTGRPPFRTGKPSEDKYLKVVARHLRQPAPDARKLAPDVDPELAALARKMMAKKPVNRPSYTELIDQVVAIGARLEGRADESQPVPAPSDGSAGRTSKTPFVGGVERMAFDSGQTHDFNGVVRKQAESEDDESAPTNLRIPTMPPGEGPVVSPKKAADSAIDSRSSTPSDSLPVTKPKVAKWLVAVTILSVLVFLTGLVLMLAGPKPSAARTALPTDASVAATTTDATPPAPEPPPEPPAGMVLVTKDDGSPWFFAKIVPVTYGEYSKIFPRQKKPSKSKRTNDRTVTEVAYKYAVEYASTIDMRLLTAAEWERAAKTEGFKPAGGKLWEWVDDGTTGISAPRSVRRGDKAAKRKPNAYRDVTFRLGVDLPAKSTR